MDIEVTTADGKVVGFGNIAALVADGKTLHAGPEPDEGDAQAEGDQPAPKTSRARK